MDNRGLLFIPDISGFTRFVNQTEIEHSRLIIQELLEVLISSNQSGLQISEIEGDAILFYKFGDSPGLEDLYAQVEKMFRDFHRSLIAYEARRFCQCKACVSAVDLTLKIITHYGEFTGYNVRNFSKLIGKDIIVAHQLLKNDIDQHEYWLVTQNLLRDMPPADLTHWMQWNRSAKQTESGEIPFHYTQLSELKNNIPPDPGIQLELSKKTKVLSFTREYSTDIITLFHLTGDFNYRTRWQEGVKAIEEVNHILPRIGMRARCTKENGDSYVYASSYSYSPDKITFSETDEKTNNATCFTLEKTGPDTTKLAIDYYLSKNISQQLRFRLLGKNKMREEMEKSLVRLEALTKEVKVPALL